MLSATMVSWISLVVSVLSLTVATILGIKSHGRRKYEVADASLNDLLKICLQHPELKDPDYCRAALTSEDKAVRYRYDTYATLVWNYLESLYDTYGEGLRKTSFYGALKDLGNRHKHWLFDDDRFHDYKPELIKFLQVNR